MPAESSGSTQSFLPRGLRWSGALLSALYGLGVRVHRSFSRSEFAPIATICIGNITVGGTGKTPATISIARELCKRGRRPAILMRGYKAQGRDEAMEAKAALREQNVPVILGGNRHGGAIEALKLACDVVLMDDGFQHWALRRDLDIVLIDASDPLGGGKIIPAGRLREPPQGLARAGAILVTRSKDLDESSRAALEKRIKNYAPNAPLFYAHHVSHSVRRIGTQSSEEWTLEKLRGLKAYGVCGIGNPNAFWRTCEKAGAELRERLAVPDHYDYSPAKIATIQEQAARSGADAVLVTEKDAAKLAQFNLSEIPFLSLRVELHIENPTLLWEKIDAAVAAGDKRRAAK